jgi:protein farnesyltransferase/geranylgeranyltransferase type-1 subunit alpha
MWELDLKDAEQRIYDDFRNNSAWNERYFCFKNGISINIDHELDFISIFLDKDPNNESPWSYLKGIVILNNIALAELPQIVTMCEKHAVSFSLALMLDIYKEQNKVTEYKEVYVFELDMRETY